MKQIIALVITLFMMSHMPVSHAGKDEAEQAVLDIITGFDQIELSHYIYSVNEDGWVDLTLDKAITGDLLTQVVKELETHPAISGVVLTAGEICGTR